MIEYKEILGTNSHVLMALFTGNSKGTTQQNVNHRSGEKHAKYKVPGESFKFNLRI